MTGVQLTSTSIPVVRKAVLEEMASRLAGKADRGRDVEVLDGSGAVDPKADTFTVSDIEDGTHEVAGIKAGRKRIDETYRLKMDVYTVRNSSADAITAVIGLYEEFRDWVQDDPSLGTGVASLRMTDVDWSISTSVHDGRRGWRAHMELKAFVACRLI